MPAGKHPIVLGFYGLSDSGKTTLVEKLISEFTRQGFAVAAVKKTSQSVSLDNEGKDTRRFTCAGAKPVVFSTPIETTIIVNTLKSESQIIADLQRLADLDFIFIEGSNENSTPKIRIGDHTERENTLLSYDGNFQQLMEFIKNLSKKEKING